jgi:hypothetical protein
MRKTSRRGHFVVSTVLDFNRACLADTALNQRINELIEEAEPPSENYRQYLGASSIGAECLRKIQYDWMCDPVFPARTKDIFARGVYFEEVTRQHLIRAGFKFAPPEQLKFKAVDGLFRGHADGILVDGLPIAGLRYPALWEAKCLKAKGYRAIDRDGLTGLYSIYAAQVALYQFYLGVTNPALFSVINADTCERLHFLVPFDAALAQTMIDRAVMIIEATRAGELLPRITDDPDNWRCKSCAHRARCWAAA